MQITHLHKMLKMILAIRMLIFFFKKIKSLKFALTVTVETFLKFFFVHYKYFLKVFVYIKHRIYYRESIILKI